MQFTEFEMTQMLHGVAKTHVAFSTRLAGNAQGGAEGVSQAPLTDDEIAVAWDAAPKMARHQVISALAEFLLPVLPVLPEVTVGPGQRATYTAEQVIEAARESVESDVAMDRITAAQADDVAVQRASLTTYALGYLPLKPAASPVPADGSGDLSADDFIVPDTLEGLA